MHGRALCLLAWLQVPSYGFKENIFEKHLADFALAATALEHHQPQVSQRHTFQLNEGVPPSHLGIVKDYKIFGEQMTNYADGKREKMILQEGIKNHPHLSMTDTVKDSDYSIYVTVQNMDIDKKWMDDPVTGWNSPAYGGDISKKLIIMDYADTPDDHGYIRDRTDARACCVKKGPEHYDFPVAYYKRAWIKKFNGTIWLQPQSYEPSMKGVFGYSEKNLDDKPNTRVAWRYWAFHKRKEFLPISYAVLDHLVLPYNDKPRTIDVLCTLRPSRNPNSGAHYEVNRVRRRVMDWLAEAKEQWPQFEMQIGQVTSGRHSAGGEKDEYFSKIQNAKIVVSGDPAYYEGDHRLWEAVAGGGMVMTNIMWTPIPFAPQHKKQIVYYDTNDKGAFLKALKYYLDNPEEAKAIGKAGYENAMMHHRSVNRIDYVLEGAINASLVPERTAAWKLKGMSEVCKAAEQEGIIKDGKSANDICTQFRENYDTHEVDRMRTAYENKVVWRASRRCAYCTHTVRILYSCCTHAVRILCSYCTHTVLILYSCCAHTVLILYSYCAHTVLMLCAYCAHTVRILCAYCAHTVRILCAYCAHAVPTPSSCCAHTVLILYTLYSYTPLVDTWISRSRGGTDWRR
jgi:hypothetical protein